MTVMVGDEEEVESKVLDPSPTLDEPGELRIRNVENSESKLGHGSVSQLRNPATTTGSIVVEGDEIEPRLEKSGGGGNRTRGRFPPRRRDVRTSDALLWASTVPAGRGTAAPAHP